MPVSQDIKNITDELIRKASNESLTVTNLYKGLNNIKELASDVANLEQVVLSTRELKEMESLKQ